MRQTDSASWLRAAIVFAVWLAGSVTAVAEFASHPPMRPLAVASSRPLPDGPLRFVDGRRGLDEQPGTKEKPWRTIAHAVGQLRPGDTLVIAGGVYHEHVRMTRSGTSEQPIVIRSAPGELAVIDGGMPEFFHEPAAAWEPCPGGVAGEFRSARTYPGIAGEPDGTRLLGNFADSMIPLHGYRFLSDLRSGNEYFAVFDAAKTEQSSIGIYCGPGVFYEPESQRIHVRLSHTHQSALGDRNYTGETDPRKLPLVIAAANAGPPLSLAGVSHVRIEDLAVRGAREAAIDIANCNRIVLDGVTAHGGSSALRVAGTSGLRAVDCAFRGIAAPWTFRGHLKYRAIEARIVAASGWDPAAVGNRDFEFARCEFTDCVDGVFIGNVQGVWLHHSLLDNVSDDGIFVTAGTAFDGTTPGGDHFIFQNRLSRCLTTFAFGVGHGRQRTVAGGKQLGHGLVIARNVFDFREPVHYQHPAEGESRVTSLGRIVGDHGSPGWEPMSFCHNTFVSLEPPWRNYYGHGLSSAMGHGTRRRVFNNLFFEFTGMPGEVLPTADADCQADGNLHWSADATVDPPARENFLRRFRQSPELAKTKEEYPTGWTTADRFADPQFVDFSGDWREPVDLRLKPGSAAIDAGVAIPAEWHDPLAAADAGAPDAGAIPAGAAAWRIGVRGRLDVFGREIDPSAEPLPAMALRPWQADPHPAPKARAAIVEGYPAFDAPLVEFALEKHGFAVERFERHWLATDDYSDYAVVAIVGDLVRAKMNPAVYSPDDLQRLAKFLEGGGVLLLMRGTAAVFATPEGRDRLAEICGKARVARATTLFAPQVLAADHAWLKHLQAAHTARWLAGAGSVPLPVARGENLIGESDRETILARMPVGRGAVIYVGWEIAKSLPNGRLPASVADEAVFDEQMRILLKLAESVGGN